MGLGFAWQLEKNLREFYKFFVYQLRGLLFFWAKVLELPNL